MKKTLSYMYVAIFLLLLIAPTIVFGLFGEWIDQTNYEQRAAAEKPAFSVDRIGEYPAAYEAFFNDHVPFRTQLIELNSIVDYFVFQKSPSDMVVLGEQGWLFYNPGGVHSNPMADYCGQSTLSDQQAKQAAQMLISARDYLASHGKEFVVMIAPNKECMYGGQYLPSRYPQAAEQTRCDQLIGYLKENTDLRIVYPKETLRIAIQEHPEYDFYYKTDTHWNYLGAYLGVTELLHELGTELPGLSEIAIEPIAFGTGDLIGMMGLTKYLQYDQDYSLSGHAEPTNTVLEFLKSDLNDPTQFMRYTTERTDLQKLCVIRDSYATAMVPYIVPHFNVTTFLHRGLYTPELLAEIDADIVVLELVEREIEALLDFTVDPSESDSLE